jgi:hemolysin D
MNPTPSSAAARHPFLELLTRYRAVFSAAWAARKELAGPKRLADEAAFLPAALAIQEMPVHPAPRRAIWAILALFTAALAWSILGQVDIVAVASGRVVVSDGTKVIQPLEAGIVKAIHVRDGSRVRGGQVLIELDPTTAAADSQAVLAQRTAALAEAQRTEALALALVAPSGDFPLATPKLPADSQTQAEWADIRARLSRLAAEITRRQAEGGTARETLAKLQTTLPLARQREADVAGLAEQGFIASHAGQDRTRERIEMERDLATQQARVAEAQAAVAESAQIRSAYVAETRRALSDRLTKARLELTQLEQQGNKATHRERITQLQSPVNGTVQQLAIRTPGGVVTPAQALLVVVPDEAEVTAEVVIENKDIGFVRAGQTAEVKVETFNFTRYGTLPATVKSVAADAVQDEKRGSLFPATLVVRQTEINVDGRMVRLSPGMTITAEIKSGRRRVISYLLSPIQQSWNQSLREQ